MSNSGKYQITADTVQIVEQNDGQVVGKQIAIDSLTKKAIDEMLQILQRLSKEYPDATESDASDIIEVDFEEIRTSKPAKWKLLRRLLSREHWVKGGRAAFLAALEHLAEENAFGKAGVAFLEEFSEEADEAE